MKTKEELPACPVATAVALIGGKWKLLILRNLKSRPWRFNELQRDLDGISQKVLTDSLRQNVTVDWSSRDSVRAKLRLMVKRILRKYKYPPDQQEEAAQLVLMKAETLCEAWM